MEFYDSELFTYLILPLMIFVARIFDVSIGTLRIIFVSKGKKYLAPVLGFFEVLIWIIAISKIMGNASNLACYIGYAAGFATGNFVGMIIEEKLAMGAVIVRVILRERAPELVELLKLKGYGVTTLEGDGTFERVNVIFTILKRADLKEALSIIQEQNPKAFYTVEDVRAVSEGVFPVQKALMKKPAANRILRWRPGK
jgi:uncharacterized protein YebE (UPF0316 family)